MSPRPRRLMAAAVLALAGLALAGCAGPYHPQIESRVLERPEPPVTAADQRALDSYRAAPYFRDRP